MKEMYCEKTNYKRAYGVTEFAQLYFPGRTPVVAYQRMWEWIRTSRGLKAKLEAAGWVKFQKLYTPKQVAVLIDHLGSLNAQTFYDLLPIIIAASCPP